MTDLSDALDVSGLPVPSATLCGVSSDVPDDVSDAAADISDDSISSRPQMELCYNEVQGTLGSLQAPELHSEPNISVIIEPDESGSATKDLDQSAAVISEANEDNVNSRGIEMVLCDSSVEQRVIAVGKKEEAQLIDFNNLKYYTIAENVLVETIDMPQNAEDFRSEQQQSTDVELIESSSDEGEDARKTKKRKFRPRIDGVGLDGEWAEEDKALLLAALKAHGSSNMELLAEQVPGKTAVQIHMAVRYYRSLAADSMTLSARELRRAPAHYVRVPREVTVPLASWRRMLAAQHGTVCARTVLADALRIIARCEYAPPPDHTSNVDFSELYHLLADSVDGRPHVPVSSESAAALRRALTEVALSSKYLQRHGFAEHLQRLPAAGAGTVLGGGARECGAGADGDAERARQRLVRLLAQDSYNPLRVPETLCTSVKRQPE